MGRLGLIDRLRRELLRLRRGWNEKMKRALEKYTIGVAFFGGGGGGGPVLA